VVGLVALIGTGSFSTLKALVLAQLVGVVAARDGGVEEVLSGQAFIIREEVVLKSPVTGTVVLSLAEGERARHGAEVARLSDTQERRQAEALMARLEAELAAYDETHGAEQEALQDKVAQTRAEVEVEADRLRRACLEGDSAAIKRSADALRALGRSLAEAQTRLTALEEGRAALARQLDTARLALEQSVFPVSAPMPGLVSYRFDGLEGVLTPDNVGSYGTRQILSLVGHQAVVADGDRIASGQPVAKIVSNSGAYLSVVVTNSQADSLAEVSRVTLRFPEFDGLKETGASLYHVGARERNGYCLVTYVSDELLDDMVSVRQTETRIVLDTYHGTIVPRSAVVERDGQTGVFVLIRGKCRFQPVTVKGGNELEVVVEGISTGTPVITTPWLVEEGTDIGSSAGGGTLALGREDDDAGRGCRKGRG